MKRIWVTVVLCVVLLGFSSLKAADQDIVLVNDTGLTIDSVFISSVSTNDWEEDILGVEILKDGEEAEINFHPDEEECNWDLMIKDEEGDAIYWRNLNLCKISKITLHYEDGTPTATLE